MNQLNRHLFCLLTELSSRKWLSERIGSFTKSKASRRLIRRFAKTYGIRVEEAEQPIDAYESLNDFFIRRLKPGLRPVVPDANSLVSPVDGTVTGIGSMNDKLRFMVKGQEYGLDELLHDLPMKDRYHSGYFIVLYLSPADYHRVHSPVAGEVTATRRIPGTVYPVHERSLLRMPKVLSRNERLITCIRHRFGMATVVKVGAMNVSSIRYTEPLRVRLDRGEELAFFEFGSTVILLIEKEAFAFRDGLDIGSKVRVGEALGCWEGRCINETKQV
ncbi:hypothetical protein Elgi_22410 [Paenibacillus elgii]|uniref:archaetidylserine decarboxylase n=1 Tax=Paenibacillus elgii TaxID=189691 RepID=UPI002D7C9E7E|nr:hypothetical protein Elgi_22410 [Paenibacillus elgii]